MSKPDFKNLSQTELLGELINMRELCEEMLSHLNSAIDMADETKVRCGEIEAETRRRCEAMVEAAKRESQAYWDEVHLRIKEYSRAVDSAMESLNDEPLKG